jgi:hypothetical protein
MYSLSNFINRKVTVDILLPLFVLITLVILNSVSEINTINGWYFFCVELTFYNLKTEAKCTFKGNVLITKKKWRFDTKLVVGKTKTRNIQSIYTRLSID